MPERLIRTFIAIDLPKALGKVACDLKPTVAANPAAVKWVVEENIHLTLRFIGPTAPGELERINGLLSDLVPRHKDFSLSISGVGCFPKKERPRVLWLGIGGEVNALINLVAAINSGLEQLGYPNKERDYSPHVTIGRIRYPQKVTPDVNKFLSADYPTVQTTVVKVRLYRSDTLPSGAVYSLLKTHQLVPE